MNKYNPAKFVNMSEIELKSELEKLTDLHEEILEEKDMMINGTTGIHRTVGHLIEKYAKEINDITIAIDSIKNLLENNLST